MELSLWRDYVVDFDEIEVRLLSGLCWCFVDLSGSGAGLISSEHLQGGLVEAKTDVAVEDGEDSDFQEDHCVESCKGNSDPLVGVIQGQNEPNGNADATTSMYDNS